MKQKLWKNVRFNFIKCPQEIYDGRKREKEEPVPLERDIEEIIAEMSKTRNTPTNKKCIGQKQICTKSLDKGYNNTITYIKMGKSQIEETMKE